MHKQTTFRKMTMPLKDPTQKKNPLIPRAPAGMETDPETGDVSFSDPLAKKPKKVAEVATYKVEFPNMENRPYSVRPHFAHDWFRQVKTAVIREGGEITMGDKKALFLAASFRTSRAALDFIKTLHTAHYVPGRDIRTYVEKQAGARHMTQPQTNEDSGKLMFDPSQYVKQAGRQPIFKRLNAKVASEEKFHEGDTVLVDMDGQLVEGQVKTTSPTTAMIAVLNDGEHDFINVPKERLSKVVAVRIPLERFPKQSLASQHRLRLSSGEYVKVTGVRGKDGHTKVSTFDNKETRWVPDEQLEVVARVAQFPEMVDHDEWV